MRRTGLTLIEMLIAAFVGVTILALIAAGLRSSGDSLRLVQNAQLLTEDLRNAGNLVSDYLSTAAFVYPPGATLTIGSPGGYSVRNPWSNNNTWQIGRDPAIALLQPPRVVKDGEKDKVVVKFVMIYPLLRGWVVRQATGAENPGPDPANDDKWLLYVYESNVYERNVDESDSSAKKHLPDDLLESIPTTIPGSSGNLLADYVQPGGFVVSYTGCLSFDEAGLATWGACPSAPPVPLQALHSASRVRFSLQGGIRQGGRNTQVPASPLQFEAAPRNLPRRLAEISTDNN